MQAAKPRLQAIPRHRGRSLDRSTIEASLALRSIALEVLDAGRLQMKRSAALLLQARTLLTRVQGAGARRFRAMPNLALPAAVVGREEASCLVAACARPAPFQPCFVVSQGIRRVLISDLPVRVCSEHRVDLEALLQRPAVLDKLRRKLRVRGREEPDAVHVVFEVVN